MTWALLTVIYLLDFQRAKKLQRFRFLMLATVLLMPFLGQLALGGFIFGSAGILWSFVSPLLAILTTNVREARRWFFGFIALVFIAVLLEPTVSSTGNLSESQIIAELVFAILGVTTFVFIFATYLLRQKDIAYHLLDIESEKSENLLLNVLPKEIVPILKQGKETIAERFDAASVLYADMVGFTPLSERMAPEDTIRMLNEIFSSFDAIVGKYDLEKIRTIGDYYMVISGAPRSRGDHVQALAQAALEMAQYVKSFPPIDGERIDFRLGMNSGPLAGGLVGKRRFHYDVWGPAVNIASRMESHGVAGRIQISPDTYALIKNDFICEKRGAVEIKGRGKMETWFLEGRR